MKLTIKWDRSRQTVEFADGGVSDVTLGQVLQAAALQFGVGDVQFGLSLNKKDVLQGDHSTLTQFGLVSGDLLHVIGPPLNPPPAAEPPQQQEEVKGQPSSPTREVNMSWNSSASNHSNQHQQQEQPSRSSSGSAEGKDVHQGQTLSRLSSSGSDTATTVTSGGGVTDSGSSSSSGLSSMYNTAGQHTESLQSSEMDMSEAVSGELLPGGHPSVAQINRYLSEPLLLRESTPAAVPASLLQLYGCAACGCACDALWVAVHCCMLEAGFVGEQQTSDCDLPLDWKRRGYYRCEYTYQLTPGVTGVKGSCSLTGVTLGSTLAVHGAATGTDYRTSTVHLQSAQYVRGLHSDVPEVYRSLDKLSLTIKDNICLPLTNELATAAGYREDQGLLAMPREVLLRICSLLDPVTLCRVGVACRDLCDVYRDRVLWRRLYMLSFGELADNSLKQDWFQLYKEATLLFKRRQEERQRQMRYFEDFNYMPPYINPMNPFIPHRPVPFPHFVGGHHDLNPEFGGIPNPMGGHFYGRSNRTAPPSRDPPNNGFMPQPPLMPPGVGGAAGLPAMPGAGMPGLPGLPGGARRSTGSVNGQPFSRRPFF